MIHVLTHERPAKPRPKEQLTVAWQDSGMEERFGGINDEWMDCFHAVPSSRPFAIALKKSLYHMFEDGGIEEVHFPVSPTAATHIPHPPPAPNNNDHEVEDLRKKVLELEAREAARVEREREERERVEREREERERAERERLERERVE